MVMRREVTRVVKVTCARSRFRLRVAWLVGTLATLLAFPGTVLAHTNGQQDCGVKPACVVPGRGPSLHLYWTKRGTAVTLDGRNWPADKPVQVRMRHNLGLVGPRSTRPAAVTGLVLMSSDEGRFRVVMANESPCPFDASIVARSERYVVERSSPDIRCMETPEPNPPVENFRVAIGGYVRAIYAHRLIHARYSFPLSHHWQWKHPLDRSIAISVARRVANVGSFAPVTTSRGTTAVGLAGLWTGVWQVWVAGIEVPGYGRGHEVMLIVRATQGPMSGRRGQVLASWYAP